MTTENIPAAVAIDAAELEGRTAFEHWRSARIRKAPWGEIAKWDAKAQAAYKRLAELQLQARDAFAASRGWRYSKRRYYPWHSGGIIDHEQCFKDKDGRAVGMVTHSYASREEIAQFAAERGWNAEVLPFSWWNPSQGGNPNHPGCLAVLFTLKAGAKWR